MEPMPAVEVNNDIVRLGEDERDGNDKAGHLVDRPKEKGATWSRPRPDCTICLSQGGKGHQVVDRGLAEGEGHADCASLAAQSVQPDRLHAKAPRQGSRILHAISNSLVEDVDAFTLQQIGRARGRSSRGDQREDGYRGINGIIERDNTEQCRRNGIARKRDVKLGSLPRINRTEAEIGG